LLTVGKATMEETAMTYMKAEKVKTFSTSSTPRSTWSSTLNSALVGASFLFVAAVVCGLFA